MLQQLIARQQGRRWLLLLALMLASALLVVSSILPDITEPAEKIKVFLFAGAALIFLFCVGKWGLRLHPYRGPLLTAARVYGEPIDVMRQIDAEVAAGHDVRCFGRQPSFRPFSMPDFVLLTPSWLVQVNSAGFSIIRLDDIIWVFERTRIIDVTWGVRRRSYGFRVYYRPDNWDMIPLPSAAESESVLDDLLRRRPEVLTGNYEDWQELLEADPGRLAAEVERRRAEWQALSPEQQTSWRAGQARELAETVVHLGPHDRDPLMSWRPGDGAAGGQPIPPRYRPSLHTMMKTERQSSLVVYTLLLLGWCAVAVIVANDRPWDFDRPGPVEALVSWFIVLAFLAVFTGIPVIRFRYYSFLPHLQRRLVELGRVRKIANQIDAELQQTHAVWQQSCRPRGTLFDLLQHRPGITLVTANWLVQIRPLHPVVIPLPELVWIHKRVAPSFSWLRGDYQLTLGCRTGDGRLWYVAADGEHELDRLAEAVLKRRPALFTGWQGDDLELTQRGPEALREAYRQREQKFQALSRDERESWLDQSWDQLQRFPVNAEA